MKRRIRSRKIESEHKSYINYLHKHRSMKCAIEELLLKKQADNILIQLFRYTFVGGTAALVDFGSFAVFTIYFLIDYRLAVFFSFTLGTLTNFFLCNAFVFDRKSLPIWVACIRHYLSSSGGLATNEIVLIFLVEVVHFNHLLIAKIIATVSAFIVNFLLIKFYAFNSKIKIVAKIGGNKI